MRAAGKLAPQRLQELVLPYLGRRRPEVRVRAGLGEDAAALECGGRTLVVSSDPITGLGPGMGRLGVFVATNDVAAMGAEPVGLQVVLLLPLQTDDGEIRRVMEEISQACCQLGVEVLGGHTERTVKVREPVVVLTALGLVEPGRLVTSAGARPGDQLLMTKAAALEGTAVLAWEMGERLAEAVGKAVVERARGFLEEVSVVREGLAAAALGVHAMHDATEGGLLGAVWEMCQASGVCAEVWEQRVPLREETRRICQALGADPLCLISSGTLLVAAPRGEEVARALREQGVEATVIGAVVEGVGSGAQGEAGRGGRGLARVVRVRPDGSRQELAEAPVDELWRLLVS
ncbi:MAG TPA: AIR synthase family protein [Limnochordales bacterium]